VQGEHPTSATAENEDRRTTLHWYDFICPFCYVGQQRNALLVRSGLRLVELPFQAHPDIPRGGIPAGPRAGPTYAMLEGEARAAGLVLNWPPRFPNSRMALAAAEWVRRNQPDAFASFHGSLFAAHFALGENLEARDVIDHHASESGVDLAALHDALGDGSAAAMVGDAERAGVHYGVQGTPAWRIAGRLIMGLRPAEELESLAREATQAR
jgi:predicted DsbA family dithiol-disulfide isomerase